MENMDWQFLVQIGILISLVILIWRLGSVSLMVEAHFEQDHMVLFKMSFNHQ